MAAQITFTANTLIKSADVNTNFTPLFNGTSGGIPYYSSATSVASSAALAQYGVVLGGGAGAAPATLAPSSSTAFPLVSGGASANPSWALLGLAGGGTGTAYGPVSAIVTKTATYAATTSDDLVLCNTNAFTVTLPAASNAGKILRIQKIGSDANAITIARAGSDTIQGATSTSLAVQYEMLTLVADGTATWYILGRSYPTAVQTWTPTGSWSTNTTYTGYWRRVADHAEYFVQLALAGAPTAASLTINLPTGHVIDTTKMTTTPANGVALGIGGTNDGSNNVPLWPIYNDTGSIKIRYFLTGSTPVTTTDIDATHPVTWANGNKLCVSWKVPIVGWN